jgi:hypothetical protein
MTAAKRDMYDRMGERGRKRQAANARKAIRAAWPYRHTQRAKLTIPANVQCLRDLRTFEQCA